MPALVLDATALAALSDVRSAKQPTPIEAALKAAELAGWDVLVPAAVLAELYRGGAHDQKLDACLGRNTGVRLAETDRSLARQVGHILARAGRGSEDHVDATVVACASNATRAVIVTGDSRDLAALSAPLTGIVVEPI